MTPRGTLTVVATPLGHSEDLSPRAAAALREADVIVAEDTRSARRLLASIGAPGGVPILSCFDANEAARAAEVAGRLEAGARVALISEAGTPLVSDPGFRVVSAAIAVGARVVPIPGPSAVLGALVAAGLPTDRFLFVGFPPRKPGARRKSFESLRTLPYTLVLYESPVRAAATLADLAGVLGGDRRACLAREISKPHEEFVRGTLDELAARYQASRPLGEVTLVVAGRDGPEVAEALDDDAIVRQAEVLLAEGRSARDTTDELTARTGRPRRDVYRLVLEAERADDTDDSDQDR